MMFQANRIVECVSLALVTFRLCTHIRARFPPNHHQFARGARDINVCSGQSRKKPRRMTRKINENQLARRRVAHRKSVHFVNLSSFDRLVGDFVLKFFFHIIHTVKHSLIIIKKAHSNQKWRKWSFKCVESDSLSVCRAILTTQWRWWVDGDNVNDEGNTQSPSEPREREKDVGVLIK